MGPCLKFWDDGLTGALTDRAPDRGDHPHRACAPAHIRIIHIRTLCALSGFSRAAQITTICSKRLAGARCGQGSNSSSVAVRS